MKVYISIGDYGFTTGETFKSMNVEYTVLSQNEAEGFVLLQKEGEAAEWVPYRTLFTLLKRPPTVHTPNHPTFILGMFASDDIMCPFTNEVLVKKHTQITQEHLKTIIDSMVDLVEVNGEWVLIPYEIKVG